LKSGSVKTNCCKIKKLKPIHEKLSGALADDLKVCSAEDVK
jgi:hypothetical protein